jgi:cell cycle checkpoint protein
MDGLAAPLPPVAARARPDATGQATSELWLDRFRPATRDELCVHPKKLDEIASWLSAARAEIDLGLAPSRRVLVLSGPTGCAKSTAARVLAAEAGFELVQWTPPRSLAALGGAGHGDGESRLGEFENFVRSASRPVALSLAPARRAGDAREAVERPRPRLLLIEELPPPPPSRDWNGGGSSARDEGAVLLGSALARAALASRIPLIIECAEDTEVGDSQWLLGPAAFGAEPRLAPVVVHISCNAVAPTLLKKGTRAPGPCPLRRGRAQSDAPTSAAAARVSRPPS